MLNVLGMKYLHRYNVFLLQFILIKVRTNWRKWHWYWNGGDTIRWLMIKVMIVMIVMMIRKWWYVSVITDAVVIVVVCHDVIVVVCHVVVVVVVVLFFSCCYCCHRNNNSYTIPNYKQKLLMKLFIFRDKERSVSKFNFSPQAKPIITASSSIPESPIIKTPLFIVIPDVITLIW